jgi:primase-polymerase (primpol)-like protein
VWAWEVIDRLDSYTEVSLSGKGVHAIVEGQLPAVVHKRDYDTGKVEMYEDLRFFVVTGNHLAGTPTAINPRSGSLLWLFEKVWGKDWNGAARRQGACRRVYRGQGVRHHAREFRRA